MRIATSGPPPPHGRRPPSAMSDRKADGRFDMFNTLDDEIKRERAATTPLERWLYYLAVVLVSAALFGGYTPAFSF
jgi:hypothetical protein